MKVDYFADSDSLYIDLSERTSTERCAVSEGVVLDYDSDGHLVGIDIDNASSKVQPDKLTVSRSPATIGRRAG